MARPWTDFYLRVIRRLRVSADSMKTLLDGVAVLRHQVRAAREAGEDPSRLFAELLAEWKRGFIILGRAQMLIELLEEISNLARNAQETGKERMAPEELPQIAEASRHMQEQLTALGQFLQSDLEAG